MFASGRPATRFALCLIAAFPRFLLRDEALASNATRAICLRSPAAHQAKPCARGLLFCSPGFFSIAVILVAN